MVLIPVKLQQVEGGDAPWSVRLYVCVSVCVRVLTVRMCTRAPLFPRPAPTVHAPCHHRRAWAQDSNITNDKVPTSEARGLSREAGRALSPPSSSIAVTMMFVVSPNTKKTRCARRPATGKTPLETPLCVSVCVLRVRVR